MTMRSIRLVCSLFALLLLFTPLAVAQDSSAEGPNTGPLTEDEKIYHLLSRLSPGPTPALIAEVREMGIDEWLEKQLSGEIKGSDALTKYTESLETLTLRTATIYKEYNRPLPDGLPKDERKKILADRNVPRNQMLSWVILRAAYSDEHVRETMADFYRQHFAISVDKGACQYLGTDWERSIIYEKTFVPFGEILEATAKHPAMLVFLDNHLSQRPATKQELNQIEQRIRRKTRDKAKAADAKEEAALQRGLNENYARELLELHTLGVDNYYTQADVINVARCLTGWGIENKGENRGTFKFSEGRHEDGHKPFLKSVIKENRKEPIREGELVIDLLTKHPGTHRFLAWKLCRWLVNDEPSDALVERMAKAFKKTGGDGSFIQAVVNDKAFFDRENFQAKFKRPWEYVVSSLRVTGAEVRNPLTLVNSLKEMNESLYRCADPTGYYDQAEAWRDPGAMATRWSFAHELATGKLKGVKIPDSFYADLDPGKPDTWLDTLTEKILPVVGLETRTRDILEELIRDHMKAAKRPSPKTVGPMITIMLLGSPEFQKQ
jgi:uncharacterized protein (DUF1800 family)